MKSASKIALVLTLATTAAIASAPAHALEVQYSYPGQVEIDSRTVTSTHRLNEGWHAEMATPRIDEVINFDTKSSKLSPQAAAKVKKVAALLRTPALAGKHIIVTGYTDDQGKDAANQSLSYHRALSVVHALIADGVAANLLSAEGSGKANPVATNSTPEGRAANRRVTFTVVCAH